MTDCVFCNFPKIKDRTVATIEGFHITISLGQITNGGYLLLIPTKHTACLGAMSEPQVNTFESLLDDTHDNLCLEYNRPVTFFEHGLVGQTIKHAHLHIFPGQVDIKKKVTSDFPSSEIQVIKNFSDLRHEYKKRKTPYLLWSTPKNEILVCWNPPAPAEYLRTITAEILGVPERASWRKMDPKLDKKLSDDTMLRLFTYFNI